MDDLAAGCSSVINVWDSQYERSRERFSFYREALCKAFMPWSPESKSRLDFRARLETLSLDQGGALGRTLLSPLVAARSKQDVAESSVDCFFANYVLRGELTVNQGDQTNHLKPGDFVIYDGNKPVILTNADEPDNGTIAFLIPKDRFKGVRHPESHFSNAMVTRDRLLKPLSTCFSFLARNLIQANKDELNSMFDACVALIPLATGALASSARETLPPPLDSHYLVGALLDFVNRNISMPSLSPRDAAEHVGISVRYVHMLFATKGITFAAYVAAKRLESIRADMLSPATRRQPISVIAYRWGFTDLSTFHRAFKKRFGCAPSHMRGGSEPAFN